MDPITIAAAVAGYLSQYIPRLVSIGAATAERVAKSAEGPGWEQAKQLWELLRPRIESRPAAREAADDLAREPADEDALSAFRLQLRKLLETDRALAEEVARLLPQASSSVDVSASGERAIAIGGNVTHSRIGTGDVSPPRVE